MFLYPDGRYVEDNGFPPRCGRGATVDHTREVDTCTLGKEYVLSHVRVGENDASRIDDDAAAGNGT
jgi:hypothetical protein